MFAEVAGAHASRAAIVSPDGEVTYAELVRRAAQVQAVLAAQPAGEGGVGLLFADPRAVIGAMLGVLRSGRFYVVLDPGFPPGRLRDIAQDGAISVVLTDSPSEATARALSAAPVVSITWTPGGAEVASLPPAAVCAQDLAYISYTSGSTGRPKGVMQPHANLLHEVAVHRWALKLGPEDRSSLMYSPGVVGSVRDIFGMLLTGGAVCAFPFKSLGFRALADWLRAQGVTQLHAVPVLYRELMRALKPGEVLDAVRTVFLAGDRVERNDVALFARHFSADATFYTGLGASEANSIYTHRFVDRAEAAGTGSLPTGWPLPDKAVLILDHEGREQPPGARGEIAVRSRYLATGYWRRSELSEKVFRASAEYPGERIYLTGDHGLIDTHGRLIHLGRGDRQLKINGERIELGEIEAVLREDEAVRAARVGVSERDGARPRLIAYVEASEAGFDESRLRERLAARLSPAARPTKIFRLDAFPLNANGKLDEAALPLATGEAAVEATSAAEVAPGKSGETALALWRELFPEITGPISWEVTLERAGGDSLHAVRLAGLLKERVGIDWPAALAPREVTPRRLAQLIETESAAPADPALAAIAGAASLWGLASEGEFVAAGLPVVRMGPDGGSRPILWVGQHGRGLEIGRALADRRRVYLVPALVATDRAEAKEMAASYRVLAEKLAAHLSGEVDLGGCCNSGWLAMIVARELQRCGVRVANVFVFDAFGSRLAHHCFFQMARVQAHARNGVRASLARVRTLLRARLRRSGGAGKIGPAARGDTAPNRTRITGALLSEVIDEGLPLRIGLSRGMNWLRVIFPRLGWSHLPREYGAPHIIPGDHLALWETDGRRRIVAWIESISPADNPRPAIPHDEKRTL